MIDYALSPPPTKCERPVGLVYTMDREVGLWKMAFFPWSHLDGPTYNRGEPAVSYK